MLQLKEHNGSFDLLFKDYLFFSHSHAKPLFSVGHGLAKYHFAYGNFRIEDDLQEKVRLTDYELVKQDEASLQVIFSRGGLFSLTAVFRVLDERLFVEFPDADTSINRWYMNLHAHPNERIYGGGEQFSCLDMKNKKLPLWVSEGGVGRNKKTLASFQADVADESGGDWYTSYYPQPSFVSTQAYYVHVVGTAYMEADFQLNSSILSSYEVPKAIVLNKCDSILEALGDLSLYLGRQPEMPDWAFDGMILGLQGGTETVLEKLNTAKENGLAVSALWVQDWEGRRVTSFGKQLFWDWKYHKGMYKDLPVTIENLKKDSVGFMGYINPFLAIEGDLYAYASKHDYLVKKINGEEYHVVITTFPAALVDLTNPSAYDWLKRVIKENLIGIGLAGWMADFGEYLPTDAVLQSGVSAEYYHNQYSVDWAKLNYEAIEETGNLGKIFFFTRAGYSGTSRYSTMHWNGDQLTDWGKDDSLASTITASLSLGFSGIGLVHSDIGGYTAIFGIYRSKELLLRWVEYAAFTPLMRTHEGNRPEENCQFDHDDETLTAFQFFSCLHKKLKPYFLKILQEYYEHGIPLIRHPILHYPNDMYLSRKKYQYLLGSDLLVAPVFKQGKTNRNVLFPDDTWVHLWTGQEFRKGKQRVEAPLGKPPVFYRKDSTYRDLFESLK